MNVYVITAGPEICKIGKADNPTVRLAVLSTTSPFKLSLHQSFPMPSAKVALCIEKIAQGMLADKRMNGEWFSVSSQTAVETVHAAISAYESPECSDPRITRSDTYPCGHERTMLNSKPHGNGLVCRTCRQAIERKAQQKKRAKSVVG